MPKRKRTDKELVDLTQEIDIEEFRTSVKGGFSGFPDPRISCRRCIYPAWYFLVILAGYLASCNTIDDIAYFAELRLTWFASLTGMKAVPCYDTLWWFLTKIKPDIFKALLVKWF